MGRAKLRKTRKVAHKRLLSQRDDRLKTNKLKSEKTADGVQKKNITLAPSVSSELFFKHNESLGPPYNVLLDANFINMSIKNSLDIEEALLDCLYAKCNVYVPDCVLAELEILGEPYRVALMIAKNPNFKRLRCDHKGHYADDCLVDRVTMHRIYIVATCDRGLRRRLRKVPGVPILYIQGRKYTVERLPEAYGAPK